MRRAVDEIHFSAVFSVRVNMRCGPGSFGIRGAWSGSSAVRRRLAKRINRNIFTPYKANS